MANKFVEFSAYVALLSIVIVLGANLGFFGDLMRKGIFSLVDAVRCENLNGRFWWVLALLFFSVIAAPLYYFYIIKPRSKSPSA